jgi:hypothetical protein
MPAPREISDLVERFAEHAEAYRSGKLVCELYGLSDDEIKIVEGATR